ncbi:hypothetical protein HN011_007638 [Eciton burchellii]|nr:hypothetical protein HN011_007638 [Eciton burchellii]
MEKTFELSEMTRTYSKFKGISFDRFEIGLEELNDEAAMIFVTSKANSSREMPHELLAFVKISFEDCTNCLRNCKLKAN